MRSKEWYTLTEKGERILDVIMRLEDELTIY